MLAYFLQYDEKKKKKSCKAAGGSCIDLLITKSKFSFMTTNSKFLIYCSQNKIWKFWTKEINTPQSKTKSPS